MVQSKKHRNAADLTAKTRNKAKKQSGTALPQRDINVAVTKWVENRLEPTTAFTSSTTAASSVFPMHFSVRKELSNSSTFGALMVRPSLDDFLTESVEPGGFVPEDMLPARVASGESKLISGEQYFLSGPMEGLDGGAAFELAVTLDSNDNSYYKGDFATTTLALVTAISLQFNAGQPIDGAIVFSGHGPSGLEGVSISKNVVGADSATVILTTTEFDTLSTLNGMSMHYIPQNTANPSVSVALTNLEVDGAFLLENTPFTDLIDDQVSATIVDSSLMWKISGLSILLKNTSPELFIGGDLLASSLPPGISSSIPNDPEDIFNYLGKLDEYTRKDLPLKTGGHISMMNTVVYNQKFKPITDKGDLEQVPVMAFAWKNPPASGPGGGSQTLSLIIKVNIELITVTQGLPKKQVSPDMHKLEVAMTGAANFTYLDSISSNDGHIKKIKDMASKVYNNPIVKQVLVPAAKKATELGIAALIGL